MQSKGDNMANLARSINCHYPTIYNFIKGKSGINLATLEKICEHYDLVLIKKYDI